MLDQTFYEKVTSQEYAKKAEKILRKEQGFYRMEQSGTLEEDAANINRIWSMEQYVSSVYQEYAKKAEKILRKEQGFYRMEQSGTLEEDAANINRIWSMEQYVSSVYSSTYHEGYQDFRKNSFQMEISRFS